MRIYNDENGNAIDFLAERNEEIKQKLSAKFKFLYREKNKKRVGFRFAEQIEDVLASYGRMSTDDYYRLDSDDIDYYWRNFQSLMAYYNLYFEIVLNRQMLMNYMGITTRMYKDLLKSSDENIRNAMEFIEDRFVGKGFLASESGNADFRAVKTRLEAKEVGHEVVSATDNMLAQAVVSKSPAQLEKELNAILGISEAKKTKY